MKLAGLQDTTAPGSVAGLGGVKATAPSHAGPDAFAEALTRAGAAIVAPQVNATAAVQQFTEGAGGNLHETLMTVDKAEISLKFLVSVRNQLVEAYREVMRMGA